MSEMSVSAEKALDGLLATLQGGDLSPMELRMLLWLAAREEATQLELTRALSARAGAIGRATRRLAARGLITRRFDRGRRSRFVLGITSTGIAAVSPLVEWVAELQPARQWRKTTGHRAG